jgi:hypothetical protein
VTTRISYMEMIYIDSDDNARHTNVRCAMETNALTWAAFNSYRHMEVGEKKAQFLLDYHTRDGNLGDTIRLDAAGFAAIANEPILSDAEYRAIDQGYWAKAQAEYAAKKAA